MGGWLDRPGYLKGVENFSDGVEDFSSGGFEAFS